MVFFLPSVGYSITFGGWLLWSEIPKPQRFHMLYGRTSKLNTAHGSKDFSKL